MLLLLLSRFSRVQLCVTPEMAAHQAPPSQAFSRQEHWSGLPVPSPTHESEKWKWSHSVVSDSLGPHGLQPTRVLHPWDFPGKSTGVGCHCLLPFNVRLTKLKEKKKKKLRWVYYMNLSLCTAFAKFQVIWEQWRDNWGPKLVKQEKLKFKVFFFFFFFCIS